MTDISQSSDSDTMQGGTSGAYSGDTTADKFKSQFASFRGQASDKARDYAGKGVDRATDALDEAARFLEDTARTIEEKLGPQYGRYGHSAAESVSGLAAQMRGKDVDELVEDVRSLVRKSPAVAIGAAVGLGFVLARLAKAGVGYETDHRPSHSGSTPGGGDMASAGAMSSTGSMTGTMPGTGGAAPIGVAASGTGGLGGTTDAADNGSPITPTFPA